MKTILLTGTLVFLTILAIAHAFPVVSAPVKCKATNPYCTKRELNVRTIGMFFAMLDQQDTDRRARRQHEERQK